MHEIKMKLADFMKEHKHLVKVLEGGIKKDLKKEAKEQYEELLKQKEKMKKK